MNTECTSTIIIGGGRVGTELATRVGDEENTVTIVEQEEVELPDENRVDRTVQGNALKRNVLETAGIETADVVVTATGDDQTNLLTCEVALKDYDVPIVLSRCNQPDYLDSFRELGIQVVSPPVACSERTYGEMQSGQEDTSGGAGGEPATSGDERVEREIEIRNLDDGVGTVAELDVPSEVALLAVRRNGTHVDQPGEETEVDDGDVLTVFGPSYAVDELAEEFGRRTG